MRYRMTHRTAYAYAGAAYESFNQVRLHPMSDDAQHCVEFSLTIDPPASVISFRDYFGNAVHDFSVPYLHDHLTIEATSDVITFAFADQPIGGPRADEPDSSPMLAGLTADPWFLDEHAEYLGPSTYVTLDHASADAAQALLAGDSATTAYGFLCQAGVFVHQRLTYRLGTTTVHSTVADVLAGGSGVCQDYAHVLIALCRQAGLPARYVSGYLGDIEASEASHAWGEAFVPPYGWIGFDPTAGAPCTGRHIKVATGRDYADVAVVRGTYRGGETASLEVLVRGEMIDAAQGFGPARRPDLARRRGEPMLYQLLGMKKQRQRLGAMNQMTGVMTRALGTDPTVSAQSGEPEAPRQQPQQQQQSNADATSEARQMT